MRRRSPEPSLAERADASACAEMIRAGSRSFHMASLLLPADVRASAYALYAFCRLSDDAVDGPGASADALERLAERLDLVYRGRPRPQAVDRAFARVIERHALPKALPEALLEGLAWDAAGRRYRTLSELNAYAARVAGAVGAMMTVLMGVREEAVLARACDLGVAMQLTNIARDIGEDARNGRVYLPLDWLDEAGIDLANFLARPVFDNRLAGPAARLLAVADGLYARSVGGVGGLPLSCRPAIHAARLIYREIGEEVRRKGYDSMSTRAVVPTQRKLTRLAAALGAAAFAPRARPFGPLPETRFLVAAVVAPSLPDQPCGDYVSQPRRPSLDERIGRVLDLFAELERRNRPSGAIGGAPELKL